MCLRKQQPLGAGCHSECNRNRLRRIQKEYSMEIGYSIAVVRQIIKWPNKIWRTSARVSVCLCCASGSICRTPRMQFSFFGLFNWWLASPPLYAFYCYYYYSSYVQWFRCSLFDVVVVLDVFASFAARTANECTNKTLCAVSTIKIPCHFVVWSSLLCTLGYSVFSMCFVCVCVCVSYHFTSRSLLIPAMRTIILVNLLLPPLLLLLLYAFSTLVRLLPMPPPKCTQHTLTWKWRQWQRTIPMVPTILPHKVHTRI